VCGVETSCDALIALYRLRTTISAISRWPDHQNSPKTIRCAVHWVMDVWVHRRVEKIGERLPRGCRG
jgi:hypothetical protein